MNKQDAHAVGGLPDFYDHPTIEGLADAPDDGSYTMRIGCLMGSGVIDVPKARALLLERGIVVDALEGYG